MTEDEIKSELLLAENALERLKDEYKDNKILFDFYSPSVEYLIDHYTSLLNEKTNERAIRND